MIKNDYRLKRLSKRITLKSVAKFVGCAESTLCRYELEPNYPITMEKVLLYKKYIDER